MLIYINRFNIREEFRYLRPTSDLEEAVKEDEVLSNNNINKHCISDNNEGSTIKNKVDSSLSRVSRNESRPYSLF